jgi:hypothetical protein
MERALPQLNEHWSMAQELLTGRCERGSAFMTNKKLSTQLLLKAAYACAYRSLSDIQTFGSPNEASR